MLKDICVCIIMELLNKATIQLNSHSIRPIFSCSIENQVPDPIYDNSPVDILNKYKNMIDDIGNPKLWDFCKKNSNEYELLHHYVKNQRNVNLGIANYDPISRSFFKLWEILKDFDIIDVNKKNITYGALAEGPGGFIEAFNFYRRKYASNPKDQVNCITLKPYSNDIPGWKNSHRIFRECDTYNISWGIDETGNLYNTDNIRYFSNLFKGNKAELVTADGGFDFSNNYSNQEANATRLILAEIVTGFNILNTNGSMVIKIFDIYQPATVDIIFMIAYYFSEVFIVKPYTSRAANSEKYLVCKGFKGIESEDLNALMNMLDEYKIISDQNKFVSRFLSNEIPQEFHDLIRNNNIYHISKQIKSLLKGLTFSKIKLSNDDINNIKNEQSVYSLAWCHKYDFPINNRCRYLNEINPYNYIPNF